jgi:probable HAF family extracellular repeat protein
MSSLAKAQPNFLVSLPQKGRVIALNNSGQVLYDTGLLTGNTFAAFPAGFAVPPGSPGILGESGVVVGTTTTGHLAIYTAGTVTDLGLPPWQVQSLTPTAIDATGQIVGGTEPIPTSPPFIYSGGVFNSININNGDLTGGLTATDLNDSGQIVLCGPSAAGGSHGFLITGAALTDLGAQCPFAINASGQITGDASNDSWKTSHAYIRANGKVTLLAEPAPFTASQGKAINKGGQIVGGMSSAQSTVAFFYNGVMTDINSLISASDPLKSSVTIASVVDINDSRLLLLLSTVPVVGASTAYLLQAPWLDVAPGPLTFASQTVGTESQPQTLTLTNSGTVALLLDSISIPPAAADFSQTNACPQLLAAAANCTVSVTFAPKAAGGHNALLNVVTDGATITVPLSGTTPITISLSATPTSATAGQAFTISWTATPGSTCQSSGGKPNDGWSATTASGSVSVVEAAAGVYTYTVTCIAGSVSAVQSLNVTVVAPVDAIMNPPASGGGGALDLSTLFLLVGSLALHYRTKPT